MIIMEGKNIGIFVVVWCLLGICGRWEMSLGVDILILWMMWIGFFFRRIG